MKYLLIENKGEIDADALTLMGGTTKRDNKDLIGFYGSGNKYALATLLKNNVDFKIYSGLNLIEVTTKQHSFRDKVLDKILINGEETSLTVQMGPEWQLWFSIREWYSNAIDEGDYNVILDATIRPKEGYTRFYIERTPEIEEIIENWDSYFTFDRTDGLYSDSKGNTIFPQTADETGIIVYRKGIRVYKDEGYKALFQYDLRDIIINESRTLSSTWEARTQAAKLLGICDNEQVVKQILAYASKDDTWENYFYWDSIDTFKGIWRKAIDNHRIISEDYTGYYQDIMLNHDHYVVCARLAKRIKKAFPDVVVHGVRSDGADEVKMKIVEETPKMKYLLKEVDEFFNEAGYAVNYPIVVVSFDNVDLLGLAYQSTIWISDKQFDKGRKEIAATIIEENEHLKTGFKDETRSFQTHFINLFLSQMEERIGNFL